MERIYVAFDGDNDIKYYYMMKAWKNNKNLPFDFIDAHDFRGIREGSTEESIKRGLRERMRKADVFVLLIGERTKYLYKYIRWEVELAKDEMLPCIAVNINGKRGADQENCPRVMLDALSIHISFNMKILDYAVNNWPKFVNENPKASGSYHYKSSVYQMLEI